MIKKLNILTLSSWYPNEHDIQQGVFIQQQLEAIQKVHNVTLVILKANEERSFEKTKTGNLTTIKIHYPSKNKTLNLINWLMAWRLAFPLLEKEKFDLLHLHVIFPHGLIALWFKSKFQIPLVVTEHWSGYKSKKSYSGFLRKKITRSILKKAKAVIVQSEFLKNTMENIGLKSQYYIVPNLVRFQPKTSPTRVSSNRIRILNVADHIDSTKNISGFIEASKTCLIKNPNLQFVQIGGGKDSEMLHDMAKNLKLNSSFEWKGRLNNKEVLLEMQNCDFGVINSNVETFSIVAFEFLAAGKPIVITNCGGPEEYLPDGFGIFTELSNSDKLAKSILKMADTYLYYPNEKFSSLIREKFSEEQFINRINLVYQATIE